MNSNPMERVPVPSAAVRAEAAAWLARLKGPHRTARIEVALRCWLAEDPERRAAFELVTDAWEKSARLRPSSSRSAHGRESRYLRLRPAWAVVATLAVALIGALATTLYLGVGRQLVTAVGEQRTITLDDGTRIYLNTDTVVETRYDSEVRGIILRRGEAFFDVAKKPNWPFVVTAGAQQIKALGTEFVVRRQQEHLAVTLVEGKVAVLPEQIDAADSTAIARSATSVEAGGSGVIVLAPGERVMFAAGREPQIDRPRIEGVTSWLRGQVWFDSAPLSNAAAEMNRYSGVHIRIDGPRVAAIRVSGSFRAGDSADFVRAVAKTYDLVVDERGNELTLRGRESL